MPGTNPSAIAGYLSAYSVDANAIAGSNGSVITSINSQYTVPGSYTGPTLLTSALNGLKTLQFSPGKALNVVVPPVSTSSLSGGAYPDGITVMAIVKATSLTNLSALGFIGTRRTIFGFNGNWNAQNVPGGLEVFGNGRIAASMITSPTLGYWGWNAANGSGVVAEDSWYAVGLISNGTTVKTFKGLDLDRTAPNDNAPAYTQFVGGFTLGADAAFPGLQDWTGEIAYVGVFDRAISDADYRAGVTWLLDRYGLPLRGIAVDARVGTTGKYVFMALSSSATGNKADIPRNATISGSPVTYKVNGGSAITPATLLYQPVIDAMPGCALLAFPLTTPLTGGETVTLSIASGAIPTTEGTVDEMIDGPVTNHAGQSAMLSQSVPSGAAMKQGFNISTPGQYWTPEGSLKNLLKCSGDNYGTLSVDSLGYRTSPHVGLRYLIRTASGDATNGTRAVIGDWAGAEFGRYVVTWEGADGSDLAIEVSASDAGQTTVTPELVNDVMTGPTKKRYFDVAEAVGSIRKRPAFDLVYKAAVYVTNVEVKLARYEGTSGLYADQVIDRAVNCEGWRFMDFIPTNFSNIAHPTDFATDNSLGYGSQTRRTIPITRIESYEGAHYGADNVLTHYLVTTSAPHGIANGQQAIIESTDGQPINVTHSTRGVVDMTYKGWIGHAISPTTFYFPDYTPSNPHEPTTVPFTGSNAILSVTVSHGASIESAAALVNETDSTRINFCVPHACTDAAIEHAATRLDATLDAGRKVDLELSNEPWNYAFSQFTYFRAEGIRRGLQAQDSGSSYFGYVARAAEMWNLFRNRWVALGRSASDLRLVFNFQQSNAADAAIVASWLQTNRPDITSVVVAVAPYHYWNGLYNVSGFDYTTLTVEDCMDFQEAWKIAEKPYFYDAQIAAFTSRGITATLTLYEYQWAYMGLGYSSGTGTRDEQWEFWNKVNLACHSHPRNYGIFMQFMDELQDRGATIGYVYGYTGGQVYEHGVVGGGYYGHYPAGLLQEPGKGDGSDGKPDNRPLFVDGQGKPKWPAYMPRVSPRGQAVLDWNAAAAGIPTLAAFWGAVSSPRNTPISSLSLTFSESVTGVGLSDITLFRDGSPVTLTGATLTGSGADYTLNGLSSLTATPGAYLLRLTAAGSGIATPALVELLANAERSWTVQSEPVTPSTRDVAVFRAFYNLKF